VVEGVRFDHDVAIRRWDSACKSVGRLSWA
jgi:hypothetical protein